MSKDQCPRCGHVFNTTGSPSKNLGYFLSDQVIETMDCEKDVNRDFFMIGFIKKHGNSCIKCPKCGKVSLYDERFEKPIESFQQISDKGLEFRGNGDPGVVNMVSAQDVIDSSKDDSIVENADWEPPFEWTVIIPESDGYIDESGKYIPPNGYFRLDEWKKFWSDRAKFEKITQLKNHIRFLENWK